MSSDQTLLSQIILSNTTPNPAGIGDTAVCFLRSTLLYLILLVMTMIIGSLTPLLVFMPFKVAAPIVLIWCRVTILVTPKVCGIDLHVSGLAHLNAVSRPCVIVCNHQCFWETIYLQLLCYPLSTVLKHSLLRIPFFGWALSVLNPIAIDRSTPLQSLKQVKAQAMVRLRQGRNILIFPEGTRRPVGQLGTYTRSAADIAKSAQAPMIAIAHNSGNYWRNKKYNKRPGTIHMAIGEPIIIGDQNTKEVMASIQAWTQRQLDAMQSL